MILSQYILTISQLIDIMNTGDFMKGIDLNKQIIYLHSSLRFFDKKEHHINRFCEENVLLLVYEGILRFSENGIEREVCPGQYYIQKAMTYQRGDIESDAPKYLYVHFLGEWTDDKNCLPIEGDFNYIQLKPIMETLDAISRSDYTYTEKTAYFYQLLSILYRNQLQHNTADTIAEYISDRYLKGVTLDELCQKFSYSKNHIINIFKGSYGITPIEYINELKIKRAMYLLEVTSKSIEDISVESGFNNYSHFYRLFYRKHGLSPSEWRNIILTRPVYKQNTIEIL